MAGDTTYEEGNKWLLLVCEMRTLGVGGCPEARSIIMEDDRRGRGDLQGAFDRMVGRFWKRMMAEGIGRRAGKSCQGLRRRRVRWCRHGLPGNDSVSSAGVGGGGGGDGGGGDPGRSSSSTMQETCSFPWVGIEGGSFTSRERKGWKQRIASFEKEMDAGQLDVAKREEGRWPVDV